MRNRTCQRRRNSWKMKVEILQQQEIYRFQESRLMDYALWIMEQIQALDSQFNWQELSLVCTDDRIRKLNLEWFGKDTVTDVISFAYPDEGATGEVIVNVQQAYEEGRLREGPDRELALYIAHGCHHLMGADDDTPERKKAMLDLEKHWVDTAFNQHGHGHFFQ